MQTKVVTTKKIRPSSGQIPQKSISASHRLSNNYGYDPFQNISTSVSDPTDDFGSIGNEQEASNSRAQKVHQTQKLAPAFGKESPQPTQLQLPKNAVLQNNSTKMDSTKNNSCQQQLNSNKTTHQSNLISKKLTLEPSEDQMESDKEQKGRRSPKNQQAQLAVERQIKYLGLVIEKDEEYRYQLRKNFALNCYDEYYLEFSEDHVERSYVPIRDKYIQIVKNSRKQFIESLERRGLRDMKQTAKNLRQITKDIKNSKSYLVQKY